MSDKNRRLLDMLAGWSQFTAELVDAGGAEPFGPSKAVYDAECDIVCDLYQEAAQIADDDGEGIAKFIFDKVLYTVLDGKPR